MPASAAGPEKSTECSTGMGEKSAPDGGSRTASPTAAWEA